MKFIKSFLILTILLDINIYPNICKSIHSFNEVKDVLENTSDKSLVVFDVDEVLIMPQDKILQKKHRVSNFRQHIESKFKITNIHQSITMLQGAKQIIEPEIVTIISNLQNRQIKVMALTYLESGSFGLINSLLEWRYNDLFKLGIDLNKNFEFDNLILRTLTPHNNNHPTFFKGIICTNLHDKGLVLSEFFKEINCMPDKVIFFDDRITNVNSVFEHMKKLNIPVYSYHYLGEEKIGNTDWEPNNIEKTIAESQFKHLYNANKWLCDSEIN